MSDTGAVSPGTIVDSAAAIGGSAWTNPTNALTSNGTFATNNGTTTHYLKCTNFGFAIPSGATINGVLVEALGKSDFNVGGQFVCDNFIELCKAGGNPSGTNQNRATSTHWPTTAAYQSWGGASNLWGLTLTDTDVNNSGFGVGISTTQNKTGKVAVPTCSIDHVRLTVYYTAAGGQNPKPFNYQPFLAQ